MITKGTQEGMNAIRTVSATPRGTVIQGAQVGGVSYKTASITITHEYSNFSDSVFFIKTQTNIPLSIAPNKQFTSSDERRPHLEIKQIITIHSGSDIYDTYELLGAIKANQGMLSNQADELRERISELYAKDGSRRNKINFNFFSSFRALEEDVVRMNKLYIRESDILITKDKEELLLPHPNSSEGLQQYAITSNKTLDGHAGVLIKIVDNERLLTMRYYYAAKQLITVPSTVDETISSGVYCTVATMSPDGFIDHDTIFYTFEEAQERVGIYRSREEALTYGNPEFALKAEEAKHRADEARIRAETRKLEGELEILKRQREMELLDQEREVKRLNHVTEVFKAENAQLRESLSIRESVRKDSMDERELHRKSLDREEQTLFTREEFDRKLREQEMKNYYAYEDLRRKDYYDSRSSDRKDTSEMIKYIPAIILGGLGAYAIINAQTKKTLN